jgi:L-fuculose-phosphate aldolase
LSPALAVIHAHPPHAIALSLTEKEIIPNCIEGLETIGKVPVLGWNTKVRPGGMAETIAQALVQHKTIMVHGHGSFAIGQLLEEACNYTTTLEESCQIICLLKSLKASPARE